MIKRNMIYITDRKYLMRIVKVLYDFCPSFAHHKQYNNFFLDISIKDQSLEPVCPGKPGNHDKILRKFTLNYFVTRRLMKVVMRRKLEDRDLYVD